MTEPSLLVMKFTIPAVRTTLIPRVSLIERLNQSHSAPLVLLSASAGFGKTTLLAAWARQRGSHLAWLSLEEADNDPLRFWTYVLAALRAWLPNWSDEDLREELPDGRVRQQVLAQVQPRSLSFFEEVMPDVPGWPDAPGGYLLFTQGYRHFLEQAQSAGWPSRTFHAGHFNMLVEPIAVAAALIELMQQVDEKLSR